MFSICGSGRGSGELGWNPKTDGAELDLDAFNIKEMKYFCFQLAVGFSLENLTPPIKKLKVHDVLTYPYGVSIQRQEIGMLAL